MKGEILLNLVIMIHADLTFVIYYVDVIAKYE